MKCRSPGLRCRAFGLLCLVLTGAAAAEREQAPVLGADLGAFDYPHPVERIALDGPHGDVAMAYMDIRPQGGGDAPVALLLHGKNFCGAYWEDTAAALIARGMRVVVPDQVGFCKSGKPAAYAYSFHQLAANTRVLLDALAVDRVAVVGHSMGGMLAMRFALMYPERTQQLVLVNPIGLEDWKAKGVPYRGVPAWYERELGKDYAAIKAYQRSSYYFGEWKPAYARWARMLAGMYGGDDVARVAWAQALTYDMVYTQPVVHELENIAVPTTLLIGQRDRTALGEDLVPEAVRETLGRYPELGSRAAERIPDAVLVPFPELGHLPHIEAPERFNAALVQALDDQGVPAVSAE